MTRVLFRRWSATACLSLLGLLRPHPAPRPHVVSTDPPVDPRLYAGLRWRNLGPFRAGRVASVSGVIGQPGVFYIGLPGGGVWKTTSAGETWYPVFDAVGDVSAVGAIEVAPSDPNVIYAGTGDMPVGGEIAEGDGVWQSDDAGTTWRHLGLDSTKHIPSMLVDPRDPNVVLVAAQGDLHRRNGARGVFRSTDGGRTWTRTLVTGDEIGGQKLARAFDVPGVVFATTVMHYVGMGHEARLGIVADTGGRSGTMLFKSTDGGVTWTEITGGGLPRLTGRTSVAVAMHTNARRVYLIGDFGLFRSDDGGTSWRRMAADDPRIRNGQGGYNCGVYVDPQNPDVVYTVNTASYRSTDGGRTFTGFKGAPGGDDPQQMWIDPTDGRRLLFGYDQGAIVSLDGGRSWSSWYNQSTEQVYHIATDASFPYWIYATQQDAGAIRTRARGDLGEVGPLDWSPVPGWEWGTILPDPLDPGTVYASGSGVVKIRYPSQQWINVSPSIDPALQARASISQPLVWAPWNPHELLAGFQFVMSTTDGGVHWTPLSPDLSIREGGRADTTVASRDRAIESMAASAIGAGGGTIWVGTANGVIQVTRDHGRTWTDVSIPGLPYPRSADISSIDASHQDAGTAYVAVDLHRAGDYAPYVYRTRDFGRTWTKIVAGLPNESPSGATVRVVRGDTRRAGLLFAGTERGMYVSFDDGDRWQSLQLGLPTTSYRDIAIHGNDLLVGTYGRGIWVLDDISVLRQATAAVAAEPAHLFQPGDAVRVRRNVNADTPFPPEVPHALNPPAGVLVDYWLAATPAGPITLDVLDASGAPVRHLSSVPEAPVLEAARPPEPNFWLAPPSVLPATAGAHRVHWDLRADPPPAFTHTFEINANPGLTPPSPEGPLALPGVYTLRLTVAGRTYTRTVTVRDDPRSPATLADLGAQHALLVKLSDAIRAAWAGYHQVAALHGTLRDTTRAGAAAALPNELAAAESVFHARLDTLAGGGLDSQRVARLGGGRGTAPPSFRGVSEALVSQLEAQDNGDQAPTPAMLAAYAKACGELQTVAARWGQVVGRDLATFNAARTRHGVTALAVPSAVLVPPRC